MESVGPPCCKARAKQPCLPLCGSASPRCCRQLRMRFWAFTGALKTAWERFGFIASVSDDHAYATEQTSHAAEERPAHHRHAPVRELGVGSRSRGTLRVFRLR